VNDTVTSLKKSDIANLSDQAEVDSLIIKGVTGRYEVEWDTEARVTPAGTLVYFAQYLRSGGLLDRLCYDTPLSYSSNNAPKERDVFGTIVLSILKGQSRYAHINSLRGDQVSAELLGFSKVVSEDSVRRALKRGTYEEWDTWLKKQERAV